MMFKLIRLKSAADQIVEQVRLLIAEGRLKPGERLPPEREMATMLGVGRQAVRTALSKLQRSGLVEVLRSRGIFVRSLTSDSIGGPLHSLLESEIANTFAFMEVRKVLESWCAEEAARKVGPIKLKRMEESLALMEEAIREGRSISKADIDFHSALAEGAGNFVLLHLMDTFTTLLHSTERFRSLAADGGTVGTFLDEHRSIYQAIKSGNPQQARRQMQGHLETVSEKIKDALRRSEDAAFRAKSTLPAKVAVSGLNPEKSLRARTLPRNKSG